MPGVTRERRWLGQLRGCLSHSPGMCLCLCVPVSPLSLGSRVPVSVGHWESSPGEEISFQLVHLCLFCFLDLNRVTNTAGPGKQGTPGVPKSEPLVFVTAGWG